MGHKAHPVGLRLGIHRKWKSCWFFDSKNYTKFIHLNLNIDKFFKGYLYFYGIRTLLLKSQIIKLASNHIFIFLFYYRFRKKKKRVFLRPIKNWNFKKWKDCMIVYFFKNQNSFLSLNNKSVYKFFPKQKFEMPKTVKNLIFLVKKALYFKRFSFKKLVLNQIKRRRIYIFIKNKIKSLKNKLEILKNVFFEKKQNKKIILYKKKLFFFKTYSFQKNLKKLFKNFKLKNKISLLKIFFWFEILFKKICLKRKFFKFFLIYLKKFVLKKKILLVKKKNKKIKKNRLFKKNFFFNLKNVKKFLSKLVNSKIQIFFINTLSFTKFFFLFPEKSKTQKKELILNVLHLQKSMLTKYKYDAIFIKDFVHIAFICLLLKITQPIVNFIGEQFKRLPKNRKQFKLLKFINQTLKLICQQRKEICCFQFQIKGRLNRRNRTHKWTFKKGILPLQTSVTRVEYAATDGFTRRGLIGIKIWIFYNKIFKEILKKSFNKYLFYSKYKKFFIKNFLKNFENKPSFTIKNQKTLENKKPFQKKNFYKKLNFLNKQKNVKTKSKKIQKK